MKYTIRPNNYLPVAAIILTATIALSAAAPRQVPFKGALQGNDVDSAGPAPNTITVTTSGTGIGTRIGQFSFTQVAVVDFATSTDTGSAHWVGANGDSIDTTLAGSGEPTDAADLLRITETHTVTDGTGRFAGAQGSFTVERLANSVTFVTLGSFQGTITAPATDR